MTDIARVGPAVKLIDQPGRCDVCELPCSITVDGRTVHYGCHLRSSAPAPAPGRSQVDNLIAAAASKLRADLTARQGAAVLAEWHAATKGLLFNDAFVGNIATGAYAWLRAKAGAEARGVDGAEPLAVDHPLVSRFSMATALHLDYIDPDVELDVGWWLTEYDVNGQYLGSAGIELGTGEPKLYTAPRSVRSLLEHPGYVTLARPPRIDADTLPYGWRAFGRLEAGSGLTTNVAAHLMRRGVELDVAEALVWLTHRRHLAAWYALWREARTHLIGRQGVAAAFALALVKATTNTFLGGWMRSGKNHSPLLRRDWSDQIIGEAGVRALDHRRKAHELGWRPLGVRRDSVWFARPEPGLPDPPPLESAPADKPGQLGKWKVTRHVQVTDAIVQAHASGSPEKLVQAVKAEAERTAA